MLQRAMRGTFTDASTLGIVMGDTNLQQENIEDVIRYGDIGNVQNCDHHPKAEYLKSCFDTDKIPKIKSDYIFAGDAQTEPIEGIRMLGLDGDHAAILAKVTRRASTLARPRAPDVEEQDVAAAKQILGSNKGETWVPREESQHDKEMGELVSRQVQENVLGPLAQFGIARPHGPCSDAERDGYPG